jgi:pyruvate/2-oxoglutarate dehydrogenase complex dihydrolipoamide acyltransferase (E2) component
VREEVTMPKLGAEMEEGEIVEWHVREGDTFQEGDIVLTIMTDKATIEIGAPLSGRIVEICAEVGDIIPVGEVIAVVESTSSAERSP